ncbi:MAG: recombinase family protein [Deltaproteobacteria bacterium]|nr:recombinase family protein [Deltaproteobacteria bacterium]
MGRPKTHRGIVRDILKQLRYGDRMNIKEIVDYLNAEGVATISGRGKWHSGSVSRLFKKWRIK